MICLMAISMSNIFFNPFNFYNSSLIVKKKNWTFVLHLFRCNVPLFGETFTILVSTHSTRPFTKCPGVQFSPVLTPRLWNVWTQFSEKQLGYVRSEMDVILGILMPFGTKNASAFTIIGYGWFVLYCSKLQFVAWWTTTTTTVAIYCQCMRMIGTCIYSQMAF